MQFGKVDSERAHTTDDFSRFSESLCELDSRSSTRHMKGLLQSADLKTLLASLDSFYNECGARSEQCKFCNGFIKTINMIKEKKTW